MASLNLTFDIWIGCIAPVFFMLIVFMISKGSVDAGPAANGVIEWMKPALMIVAGVFLGIGLMLGFYVPLYPFMIFTFGVIGWLITVLEAMVAAPLVCLGLTHPEGHDFLGEAKQAMMLLLGVFIIPVLMVIGLFASTILSYVA